MNNSVPTIETRYDVQLKKLESDVGAIELANRRDGIGKAIVTDIQKEKLNIENCPEHVDSSDTGNSKEALNIQM